MILPLGTVTLDVICIPIFSFFNRFFKIFRSRGYSSNQNTTYWTDLFVRHFLFQTDYAADRDDLLFFIRKGNTPVPGSLSKHNKQHTTVEVRLGVSKIPKFWS